jgi:hypothetical protein
VFREGVTSSPLGNVTATLSKQAMIPRCGADLLPYGWGMWLPSKRYPLTVSLSPTKVRVEAGAMVPRLTGQAKSNTPTRLR